MSQGEQISSQTPESQEHSVPMLAQGRGWRRARIAISLIIVVIIAALYFSRERIARNILEDQLVQLDLPATYDIEQIGTDRQVLTNLVFGDPAAPDLTIERLEVALDYSFGAPQVGQITVLNPRLFGTYRDGVLSFGSLDTVLFAESEEPPRLPENDINLIDGRVQLLTDYGPIGIKAAGQGVLTDGFAGMLAVSAPELEIEDCSVRGATLYGDIAVSDGEPGFDGPLRLAKLNCRESGVSLAKTDLQISASIDEDFTGGDAKFSGEARNPAYQQFAALGAVLGGAIAYRDNRLAGDYDIELNQLRSPQFSIRQTSATGSVRMSDQLSRTELQVRLEGSGVQAGVDVARSLSGVITSAEGTLAEPLLVKLRDNLTRELRGGTFAADAVIRQTGSVTSAVIPEARIRGSSGETILALSRLQYNNAGIGPPLLSANIATGGRGLPRIFGRMEAQRSGGPMFRLRMGEYQADNASITIPEMQITQSASGSISFAGQIRASGPLPGGAVQALVVPVDGSWSEAGGIALWRGCTNIAFRRLQLANLAFERRSLNLCPTPGRSIVDQVSGSLRIAGTTPSLDLAGVLGKTPIEVKSGTVDFAYPGALTAEAVEVTLGLEGETSSFLVAKLSAEIGDEIAGQFGGADISLFAAPLDLRETSGDWRFADRVLNISGAEFRLEDREQTDRFEPLMVRDAKLELVDNMILADAVLRTMERGREIAALDMRHDLETGTGSADLLVRGIRFGDALQPDELSYLAKGVIANAEGVITGNGQIEWNADTVTSRGSFSTDSFDFAAAFGPVKGAQGTVEFVDLINLTTAPGQTLSIASVNSGVEVVDGTIGFAIRDGEVLDLESGAFKFAGGTLEFQPVTMRFGAAEVRRYVINVSGLDAAQFVAGLELNNISATGTFDGSLPLIFDEMGNGRIEGGLLIARAPGGNVSYVGELTYEEITPIVDFAFDALRSLDYEQMRVEMEGSLSGELVTRVEFDGISQGDGARSNFITRQIGQIPLKFRINVRGPFAKILSSLAAMTDPTMVRDPRELGLVGDGGQRLRREITDVEVTSIISQDELPVSQPVQGQESENMP